MKYYASEAKLEIIKAQYADNRDDFDKHILEAKRLIRLEYESSYIDKVLNKDIRDVAPITRSYLVKQNERKVA